MARAGRGRGRGGGGGGASGVSRALAARWERAGCRECSVSVTRMDFAKILGKFTKVKIQYETSPAPPPAPSPAPASTPRGRRGGAVAAPPTRLRGNRNGMVLLHRAAYKEHPVTAGNKAPSSPAARGSTAARGSPNARGSPAARGTPAARNSPATRDSPAAQASPAARRGRPPKAKPTAVTPRATNSRAEYRIVFERQNGRRAEDREVNLTMAELLPRLSVSMLPTEDWIVDYAPRESEPKRDHVYDRIAAELEDLMQDDKTDVTPAKIEDFPSIMDLLSDATDDKPKVPIEKENNNEIALVQDVIPESDKTSNMPLLDCNEITDASNLIITDMKNTERSIKKDEVTSKEPENNSENSETDIKEGPENVTTEKESEEKMETDENKEAPSKASTEDMETNNIKEAPSKEPTEEMENDANKEAPSKELIEEKPIVEAMETDETEKEKDEKVDLAEDKKPTEEKHTLPNETPSILGDMDVNVETITDIIFKRVENEACNRLVKCSKNLNYSIEIDGKPIELVGAPKYISCAEDLQVMLQIVHDSDLNSFNVVQEGLSNADVLLKVMN